MTNGEWIIYTGQKFSQLELSTIPYVPNRWAVYTKRGKIGEVGGVPPCKGRRLLEKWLDEEREPEEMTKMKGVPMEKVVKEVNTLHVADEDSERRSAILSADELREAIQDWKEKHGQDSDKIRTHADKTRSGTDWNHIMREIENAMDDAEPDSMTVRFSTNGGQHITIIVRNETEEERRERA